MNDTSEAILQSLKDNFFAASNITPEEKHTILSSIITQITAQSDALQALVMKEVHLTASDAAKEIDRAKKTFTTAISYVNEPLPTKIVQSGKIVHERRRARGPLLAITPFSSPLSSPAHKISMGLLAGTSIALKPSPFAQESGRALFEIIQTACNGKYVYFSDEQDDTVLSAIVADERIGIISFTGGYETGKKIIRNGGVKKYHMELAGGNSPVIFTPQFDNYNDALVEKLVEGIVAKNGQRCVSIKHIFLPGERITFVDLLQAKLQILKDATFEQLVKAEPSDLGSLICIDYANKTNKKVADILRFAKDAHPRIPLQQQNAYIFPTMYELPKINPQHLRKLFDYDIPGPVVFIHLYNSTDEYKQILAVLKNDYIRSGIQLSVFAASEHDATSASKDLLWGGIVVNDIPTFRSDTMSFGGFGKSGLGKEGFIETLNSFTDPQTVVFPENLHKK